MKRRRAWGLAQLLLLAAAVPCFQASLFDSHIVHPKSYLDTLKSTRGDQMLSTNVAPAACDPSAAGSCQHSASHPQLLDAQQPPAVLNSGLASSWNVGTTSAGASSDPTRSLQQRAANPLCLQPPYNVCVSSWEPMVRCTESADQSEYQGRPAFTWGCLYTLPAYSQAHGMGAAVAWMHVVYPDLTASTTVPLYS